MAENLLQEIERRLQRMTEEQKKIVLAALGEPDDICKQECEAV
jgi:DNA-binding MurR/RpiR family transcriptional regulator